MENIKENYELMFTEYPDIVNIVQLKEMIGIGSNLAYKLVRNKNTQKKYYLLLNESKLKYYLFLITVFMSLKLD